MITAILSAFINNVGALSFIMPIANMLNKISVLVPSYIMVVILIVMGPGGYKFTDYWRLGLPISLLVILIATPLILFVWPL